MRVERVDGRLLVDVSDDGVGGASADLGSGLRRALGSCRSTQRHSRGLESSGPRHPPARRAALRVSDAEGQSRSAWGVGEDSFLLRAGVVRVLEHAGFAVVGEARGRR